MDSWVLLGDDLDGLVSPHHRNNEILLLTTILLLLLEHLEPFGRDLPFDHFVQSVETFTDLLVELLHPALFNFIKTMNHHSNRHTNFTASSTHPNHINSPYLKGKYATIPWNYYRWCVFEGSIMNSCWGRVLVDTSSRFNRSDRSRFRRCIGPRSWWFRRAGPWCLLVCDRNQIWGESYRHCYWASHCIPCDSSADNRLASGAQWTTDIPMHWTWSSPGFGSKLPWRRKEAPWQSHFPSFITARRHGQ